MPIARVSAPAPEFRRVLAAEVVSNFGSMLSRLAIPWIATLALAATPFEMGFLLVADVAAGAAGALLVGALVDRVGKRGMMLATDVARAALLGALALLAQSGGLAFWMLVAAAAANGLLTVAFELARSAWVAQRMAADDLPTRNAQLSAGMSLAETAAFALGGWLYQAFGAVFALVVDALSYALSALFLRGVRETPAAPLPPARLGVRILLDDARHGLETLFAHPTLRVLATVEVLLALAMSLAGTSYMIFVARDLGFGTGILGLIFAAGGLGSLAGAWLAPRAGRSAGPARAMRRGLILLALGAACIPLAPGATAAGAALLVLHQVIGDGGRTLYDVHDRTLRQTAVEAAYLARVDAGLRTLGHLATLAGALAGGALATALGAREALVLSALLLALAALVPGRLVART